MKRYLIATLTAVCGAAVVWIFAPDRDESRPAPPQGIQAPQSGLPPKGNPKIATGGVIDWRSVESEDYRIYIANLRRIGCPEQTVGEIIRADVNALFKERAAEVVRSKARPKYWAGKGALSSILDSESASAIAQLEMERKEVLAALLGEGAADDDFNLAEKFLTDSTYEFMPPEKRESVKKLLAGFDAERVRRFGNVVQTREALLELRKFEDAKEKALAGILSPEELFEYRVRFSPDADFLRNELSEFGASEGEFREILTYRQKVKDAILQVPESATTEERQAQAKDILLGANGELSAKLGAERYAEYNREQDGNYKEIRRIAGEAELDKAGAQKAYSLHAALLDRIQEIQRDTSLDAAAQTKARQAASEAAFAHLEQVLGSDGYAEYFRIFGERMLKR